MENEFKTLSQDDIDAMMSGKASGQESPPDPVLPLPTDPEGPLPKVINLTGLDVSRVVPNLPAVVPPSSPPPEPVSETPPAISVDQSDPRIEKLEQSVAETNNAVQQVRQELQSLIQQVQILSQGLESISKGLKDTPSYRVRETFACGACKSQHNVAMPVKCTDCGRINWWGWWPSNSESEKEE